MANGKTSIWVYKKVAGRWTYTKPQYGRNNKIVPDPDGTYYIRYYEGKRSVLQKCASAADAENARRRQEAFLVAHAEGVVARQQRLDVPQMVSDT